MYLIVTPVERTLKGRGEFLPPIQDLFHLNLVHLIHEERLSKKWSSYRSQKRNARAFEEGVSYLFSVYRRRGDNFSVEEKMRWQDKKWKKEELLMAKVRNLIITA